MKTAPLPEAAARRGVSQQENEEIDLMGLLRTLWRGKWIIALVALAGLILGGYQAFFRAVPVYTSSAVVALESRQEQVVDLESVVTGLSGDQATINTEVEVIRSRGLAEKLVDRQDLVADPEFNTRLQPEPRFSLRGLFDLVRGLLGAQTTDAEPTSDRALKEAVIDRVQRSMSVSNVRNSYVFRISATTEHPEKSAAMANTLADLYILEQIEVKFAATEKATEWLTDRVGQLQIELEEAEAAVKDFNAGTDLVSPEALGGLNRQLKELRDRLREARETLQAAQTRLGALETAREAGDIEEMARLADDPTLDRVLRLLQNDGSTDRGAFDARFEQVLDRARLEVNRAESQIATLQSSIATQEDQIDRQSADLVKLQQLQREAEASRLIYEYFLNRLKETSIQQGIQQADSRILSDAVIPRSPSAPRKSLILAISLILGAIAGAALVLGREFAQNTYRVAEDLEAKTGYPVLGQIPAIPARRRKNVLKYLTEKPTSAAAEAIRNLRTSVLLSDLDHPPQIIMSTSSVPGEGKTTQSIALTQNLAGMGKRVLLIEGDLRRRVFSEYFDIKGRKGLMTALSKDKAQPLSDIVIHEDSLGADLLLGEKTSINAADVFSSETFRDFLKELRGMYDYVVIDTPPVLAVPDARVIGQSVDAIVYTVKWDSTPQRQVRDGLRSFESVNVRVTGLVLGQINARGMKRYGYGDSYGAYNSYYDN